MRPAAFALVVAFAMLVGPGGCALGPNDELKGVVEEALLPGMDRGSCEWGSSTYEHQPKSWYGCWDYVPGHAARVATTVQSHLRSHGFEVSETNRKFTVEVTAVRGSETVCVDVLASGFVNGRNTSPAEINPDPDEVFVDVWMVDPREGGVGACSALPAWEE